MNCRKCVYLETKFIGTLDPTYYCCKHKKKVNDLDLLYNFFCTEEIDRDRIQ